MSKKKRDVFVEVFIDGRETLVSASELGLTRKEAELINAVRKESDDELKRFADYDRHNNDLVVEGLRRVIQDDFTSNVSDPLENIADPNSDIFSILYPEKQEISSLIKAVNEIIDTLPDSQKDFYQRRYVFGMTYEEIGKEEKLVSGKAVSKQAEQQKDIRFRNQVEKRLKAKS